MSQHQTILDSLGVIDCVETTLAGLLVPEPDLHIVDRDQFATALQWLIKERTKLLKELRSQLR